MARSGGLLGGGGGSPLDLYGDLFTDEQKQALQQRELSQGLLGFAAKLGAASAPSPVPKSGFLGLLGQAAGGFASQGDEQALKGMEIAEKVRSARQERAVLAKVTPIVEAITRQLIKGGVPAAEATQIAPQIAAQAAGGGGAPAGGSPASNAPPPPQGGSPSDLANIAGPDWSPLTPPGVQSGAPPTLLPIPPAPPGGRITPADYGVPGPQTAPGQQSLLPPPPSANPQMGAAPSAGGGLLAGLPFNMAAAPGAGGDTGLPDLGQIQVELLSGQAAPVLSDETLRKTSPVPSLGGAARPASAWQQGYTYDQPKVPYGQAPEDRARPEGGYGSSRADTVAYWRSRGMPQHVAEGIADRVGVESSYRSDAIGDKGTSGGLYQHHADRLARLKNFAASEGKPWTDPDVQHRFAGSETQGGDPQATRAMSAIADAPDRQTAAKLWDRHFERSAAGPGSRLPDVGGVRVEPLSGEAAPAGGGGIAGTGVTPEALAALNAMLKLGGIKSDPFGSLLESYYKSPGYIAEKARTEAKATKDVALDMDPLIAKQVETAKAKVDLEYKPLIEQAVQKLQSPILKEREEAKADIARVTKELEQNRQAGFTPVTVTVTPPGEDTPREITIAAAQLPLLATGKGIPDLGLPPGTVLGKPVLSPGETTRQQRSAEAPYTTKDVELTWPDGETRKVTVTGQQAKDIAEGRPVPVIGWPGTAAGGAAMPADDRPRGGATVYPPGHAEATTVLLKERRPKAEAAVQSLQFNDIAKQLLDAGIISGTGAGLRLDAAKAASLFGWDSEKIAATESFLATQARQVASVLGSGAFGSGASITDEDRRQVASMVGANANLDEKSLRFLVRLNETAANWEIDRYSKDVDKHDPKNRLPILRVDRPPKAEAKPPVNNMSAEAAQARSAAAAAIAKGAPKDAVLKRLQDAGIDTGGL